MNRKFLIAEIATEVMGWKPTSIDTLYSMPDGVQRRVVGDGYDYIFWGIG